MENSSRNRFILICAFRNEAVELIRLLQLRRLTQESLNELINAESITIYQGYLKPALGKYEIYFSDQYLLVISGLGKVKSALAVNFGACLSTILLPEKRIAGDLHILNFGVAGSVPGRSAGETFRINKIKDNDTGRQYYPDILTRCSYEEAGLLTCSIPQDTPQVLLNEKIELADMEASGFYEAALLFTTAEKIHVIKTILDNCNIKEFSKDLTLQVCEKLAGSLKDYLESFNSDVSAQAALPVFNSAESEQLENFSKSLKLTFSQTEILKRAILRLKFKDRSFFPDLAGFDAGSAVKKHRNEAFRELILNLNNTYQ